MKSASVASASPGKLGAVRKSHPDSKKSPRATEPSRSPRSRKSGSKTGGKTTPALVDRSAGVSPRNEPATSRFSRTPVLSKASDGVSAIPNLVPDLKTYRPVLGSDRVRESPRRSSHQSPDGSDNASLDEDSYVTHSNRLTRRIAVIDSKDQLNLGRRSMEAAAREQRGG